MHSLEHVNCFQPESGSQSFLALHFERLPGSVLFESISLAYREFEFCAFLLTFRSAFPRAKTEV
jgi:hypothetical protein